MSKSIYCKYPMGISFDLSGNDGNYTKVVLNGANHSSAVCGFGITVVNDSVCEALETQKKEHPGFINGFIFVKDEKKGGNDKAIEMKDKRCGMEQINPDNPVIDGIEKDRIKKDSGKK